MLKKYLTILLVFSFLFFSAYQIAVAQNLNNAFGDGSNLQKVAGGEGAGYTIDGSMTIDSMIAVIVKTALSFLGVIFLSLMVYGGYLWMTDRGNAEQVEKAKKIIQAAIIGLIIVVSAYAITWFVVSKMGGAALGS